MRTTLQGHHTVYIITFHVHGRCMYIVAREREKYQLNVFQSSAMFSIPIGTNLYMTCKSRAGQITKCDRVNFEHFQNKHMLLVLIRTVFLS